MVTPYKEVNPLAVPESVRQRVAVVMRHAIRDLRLPDIQLRWFKKALPHEKPTIAADEDTVAGFFKDNPQEIWMRADLLEEEAAVLVAETLFNVSRFSAGQPLVERLANRYARNVFYELYKVPAVYGFKEGDLVIKDIGE